jgi:hypothetical protein
MVNAPMKIKTQALRDEGFEVVPDLLDEIAREGRSPTLGTWIREARAGLAELGSAGAREASRAEDGLLAAVQLLAELAGLEPQRDAESRDDLAGR